MKRYISLLLCLCMAAGFAAPAYATESAADMDLSAVLAGVVDVTAEEDAAEMENAEEPEISAEMEKSADIMESEAEETPAVSVEESAPVVNATLAITSGTINGTNLSWSLEDGVLTVSGEGAMKNFGYGNSPWHSLKDSITAVVIGEGVTTLGKYAFHDSANLETVMIPSTLEFVGERAFQNCTSIVKIELPAGVTEIEDWAFSGCAKLESVSLAEGLTTLGHEVFSECTNLKSLLLPESVTSIGYALCSGCIRLENVTLPSSLSELPYRAFENCSALKEVEISKEVISIEGSVFLGCSSLTEITIPDKTESIAYNAFAGCTSLGTVYLPKSLKSIGTDAFIRCTALTDVYYEASQARWALIEGKSQISESIIHFVEPTLPVSGTVTNVLGQEFLWSIDADGVFTVTGEGELPDYESIDKYGGDPVLPPWIDYRNMITKVIVGEGVTRIGHYSFEKFDGVLSAELSEGLREIGNSAFSGCNALKIDKFPDSLTTLGNYAFYACALESLTISSGMIDVGYNVFSRNLALTEVIIAAADLGETCSNMFENCTGLTTVTVEEGVKKLPAYMFNGCTALKTVELPSTLEIIGEHCFIGCSALTSIELPEGLKSIGEWAFRGCDLQSFDIPESVETVGGYAYSQNMDITSVTVPAGVTMGSGVFYECTGIKTVTIEEGVTEVAPESFKECSALKTVKLASTVEAIGEGAFQNCPLTSITLPAGLKTLGGNAFYGCNLSSITLPDGLEAIGNGAFAANENITKATIPGGVSKIETYIFRGCTGLKTVTLEEGVTFISGGAFSGCDNLTTLKLPSTIETICWSFELPSLQTMSIAEDPEGKRSFVCWQDEEGYVYTTQDIVDGVEFNGQLHSVWKNIWIGYNDVPEDAWYIEYVKYCYEIGLMNGMGDGNFNPDGSATRGQVVTVLYRMAGEPEAAGGSSFTDVYEGDWYYDAIAWAASEGIAQGMGDGTFAPNENVTREQFLVFLYRFVDYLGLILNDWETRYTLDSIDADSVSAWALDAQVWSLVMGLQTGYEEADGYSVRPQNWITRAEMATFLARYASNMVLYHNGEVAESLWYYTVDDVVDAFGDPGEVVEKDSTTQYWYYDDYGIAMEIRWHEEEEAWYEYAWWWNY